MRPVETTLAARQAISRRRFEGLTPLDEFYLQKVSKDYLQHEESTRKEAEKHDPVRWLTGTYLPTAVAGSEKQREAVNVFTRSYSSIVAQSRYGRPSEADKLFLVVVNAAVHVQELMPNYTENPNSAEFVITQLRQLLQQDEPQAGKVADYRAYLRGYIEVLGEVLRLNAGSTIARINQQYIDYLTALSSVDDIGQCRARLSEALQDDFIRRLHTYTMGEEPTNVPLTTLMAQRATQVDLDHTEMRAITLAYLTADPKHTMSWSLLPRDHYYTGATSTSISKSFVKVIHHITMIGGAEVLTSIQATLEAGAAENVQDRAKSIHQVANQLYDIFISIQETYYHEINDYYQKALLKIYGEGATGPIPADFKAYCDAILFEDAEAVNTQFEQLLQIGGLYTRKRLKQVEHCLLCELKPTLDNKKSAVDLELKQLKQNIHHFMQANGLHSRLQRQPQQALQDRPYQLSKTRDMSNFFIHATQQQKRSLNEENTFKGELTAAAVAAGEGTVAAVALAVIIPLAPVAVIAGGITFLAGFTLNRFLLLLDTIGLFKAIGFNRFNRDEHQIPLEWYKKGLNWLFASLAFLGTGVVFAAVFTREFIQMALAALSPFHAGLKIAGVALASVIAAPIALAELCGISALIHMANRNLIIQGLAKLWDNIKFYFYKRFYVALPEQWDTTEHISSNLLEILINTPRLLVSTLLTLSGLSVMLYYMKMTFVFFASCVTGLLTSATVPTALATVMGNVASGINVVTTIMSFTVPLGKIVLQIIDTAIKFAIFTASMTIATLAALIAIPIAHCIRTNKAQTPGQTAEDYFSKFWNAAITTHAWLTSNSILVKGGLDWSIMQDEKRQQAEAAANPAPDSGAPTSQAQTIQKRDQASAWFKQKIVYPFFLLANSLGQAFLFLPHGAKSLGNAIHVLEAAIQGTRSGAMNLNGINRNMAIRQGGKPMTMFQPQPRDLEVPPLPADSQFLSCAATG